MALLHPRDDAFLRGPRVFRAYRSSLLKAFLALAGLLLVLVAIWFVRERMEQASLGSMSAEQRRALYQQTLEYMRAECAGQPGGALAAHCGDEARFLRHFPECDAECRALTAPYLPFATK